MNQNKSQKDANTKSVYRVINNQEIKLYSNVNLLKNMTAFNGQFCKDNYSKNNNFNFDEASPTGKAKDESFLFFFESKFFSNTYKTNIAKETGKTDEEFEVMQFDIPEDLLIPGIGKYYSNENTNDTKQALVREKEYILRVSDYKPEFFVGQPNEQTSNPQETTISYDPDAYYFREF